MNSKTIAPPALLASGRRGRHPRRGFTLVEMLISLLVMVVVVGTVLLVFDAHNRIARIQGHVSEMQQSLRIAQHDTIRMIRMAGRGGVPRGNFPEGLAVSVRNNVPDSGDSHHIAVGDIDSPPVLTDTDVLTIRAVLNSPIYQANPAGGSFNLDSTINPTVGNLRLQDPSPTTGVPQDLRFLATAIQDENPDALMLVSPLADEIYAVVELDPNTSSVNATDDDGNPTDVTLGFRIAGGTYTDDYLALSAGGVFPTALRSVAFAGLLEEYRFYLQEDFAVDGDANSQLTPRLSRARMYPGTEIAYGGDPVNLSADIADGVMDLQIALGIDVDGDDQVLEDPNNPAADEWLYNDPGDDPNDAGWDGAGIVPTLYYVRVHTLARTNRPDPRYQSPAILAIEDHVYLESDPPGNVAELAARQFRRRRLQSVVDMRNL